MRMRLGRRLQWLWRKGWGRRGWEVKSWVWRVGMRMRVERRRQRWSCLVDGLSLSSFAELESWEAELVSLGSSKRLAEEMLLRLGTD